MAKYTDIKATSLVAAHTIGKSIITAPLEMEENIDDITGPAHDNVSFDSRMLELMMTGPEGFNNTADYTLQAGGKLYTIEQLCNQSGTSGLDVLPTNKNLICVPETFYEIGDVIFYSPITNKFSKISRVVFIEQWSDAGIWSQKWAEFTRNNIPIGIIVIPSRLDVYGDGSALMASIRPITPGKPAYYHWTGQYASGNGFETLYDWNNDPDRNHMKGVTHGDVTYPNIESYGIAWALNGTYNENTYYNYSSLPSDSILMPLVSTFKWIGSMFMIYKNVNQPLAEASMLSDSILNDGYYYGAMPIYYDSTLQGLDTESDDRIRYINIRDAINSKIKSLVTYTNSGQIIKNPNQFDHLIASNGEKNMMLDFNGYDNTKILQEINREEAWQHYVIYSFNGQNNYEQTLSNLMPFPAMAQVWEFYTPGTNRGDWYMPSLGEMGFIMRELNPNSQYQYLSILRDCYAQELGVCGVPTYQKTNPLGPIYTSTGTLPTSTSSITWWCTSSIMYDPDPDFGFAGLYDVSYYDGVVSFKGSQTAMQGILPVMRIR